MVAKFKEAPQCKEKGKISWGLEAKHPKSAVVIVQRWENAKTKRKARAKLNKKQKRLNPQRRK